MDVNVEHGEDSPEILAGIAQALESEDDVTEGDPEAGGKAAPAAAKAGEAEPEKPKTEETGETEEAAEDSIEIDPDAPLFEIQIAGEAKKLSLTELQAGYADREQLRAQNVDLQRAAGEVDQKVREAVTPITQEYQQNIQVFQKAVWGLASEELANVNFAKLAKDDPAEAVRLSARVHEIQGILQAAQEEITRTQQQEEQAQIRQRQEQAHKSVEILKRDIPGWGPELYSTVLKAGVQMFGFTPEEVESTVDARHIKVLHDAYKYRQLQDAKPNITKRLVSVPKMLKPGNSEDNRDNSKASQIQARFRKSGSVNDMAALLLATGKG